MKRYNRLLSVLLSFAMILSMASVSICAAEATQDQYASFRTGSGYVAMGDSFTRGYGASNKWIDEVYRIENKNKKWRNVTDSYPYLIAQKIGLKTPANIEKKNAQYWPLACDALSTTMVLDLLGIEDKSMNSDTLYKLNQTMKKRYEEMYRCFGDADSLNYAGVKKSNKKPAVMSIHEMFETASLFTVHVGLGDILYRIMNSDWTEFGDIRFDDPVSILKLITKLSKKVDKYIDSWAGDYQLLLDYIKQTNKNNAKVILVGAMNPLQNLMISDELLLPVGSLINSSTDKMNCIIAKAAKKYGFIYVDINNVDTPSTEEVITLNNVFSTDIGLDIHPTPNGYKQVARMVVAAIDKELAKETSTKSACPGKDIKVDIGTGYNEVKSIKVAGKKIKKYDLNEHLLTIPYCTKTAKTMTVKAVKVDGRIATMKYTLKYSAKKGYSARRTSVTISAAA